MSSEKTPVASRAVIYLEMFINDLELLGDDYPELKPFTNATKKWAFKYYARMDDSDVHVITMCELLLMPPNY
jgi:hypothetical protein